LVCGAQGEQAPSAPDFTRSIILNFAADEAVLPAVGDEDRTFADEEDGASADEKDRLPAANKEDTPTGEEHRPAPDDKDPAHEERAAPVDEEHRGLLHEEVVARSTEVAEPVLGAQWGSGEAKPQRHAGDQHHLSIRMLH
jgi:hypothetical protein